MRKLQQLHAAPNLDFLRAPPGNRLQALSGDRAGQHSAFFVGGDAGGCLALQAHHDTEMVRQRLSDVLSHIPRCDPLLHNPIAARTAAI